MRGREEFDSFHAMVQIRCPEPETADQTVDVSLATSRVAAGALTCGTGNYLFENWNRLRAPFWPYFLRSFCRGSRRSIPAAFNFGRSSGLKMINARAMPIFTAPAWPFTPPP